MLATFAESTLSGLTLNELGTTIIRIIVTAVAAVVGWIVFGLVAKLLARVFSGKPMPTTGSTIASVAGAILFGYLAYVYVPELGLGRGGGGNGEGTGKSGDGSTKSGDGPTAPKTDDTKKSTAKTIPKTGQGSTVEVEILSTKPFSAERWYHFRGAPKGENHTKRELEKMLVELKEKKPDLKVILVIYDDSPDVNKPQVTEPQNLLQDLEIPWERSRRKGLAP